MRIFTVVIYGNGSRLDGYSRPFLGDIIVIGYIIAVLVKNSEAELQGCVRNNVLVSDGSSNADSVVGAKTVRASDTDCLIGTLNAVVNEFDVFRLTGVEDGDGARKNRNGRPILGYIVICGYVAACITYFEDYINVFRAVGYVLDRLELGNVEVMVGAKSSRGKSDRAKAVLCSVVNNGNASVNAAVNHGDRARKNRKSSKLCHNFVVSGNVIVIHVKHSNIINIAAVGVVNRTNVEYRAVGIGSLPLVTVYQLKLAKVEPIGICKKSIVIDLFTASGSDHHGTLKNIKSTDVVIKIIVSLYARAACIQDIPLSELVIVYACINSRCAGNNNEGVTRNNVYCGKFGT